MLPRVAGSVWLRLQAELGRLRSPAEGLGSHVGIAQEMGSPDCTARPKSLYSLPVPTLHPCLAPPPKDAPDHSKGPTLRLLLCARAPGPTPS